MRNKITFKIVFTLSFLLSIAGSALAQPQYAWSQKANFGGGLRYAAIGFSIGNKGYAGTGNIQLTPGNYQYYSDFWEYDPQTDIWTQKADLAGEARYGATSFGLNGKGYVTTGWHLSTQLNDLWEYDPTVNTWTQKSNFGGTGRYTSASFVIGNYAYVGTGYAPITSDFWRYDPSNDSWMQVADIGGLARQAAKGFGIGNYGYVFGGDDQFNYHLNELWRYDPATNTWIQKASLPGAPRGAAAALAFNDKGFVGTGADDVNIYQDFYCYDPINDSWTQIMDFGGGTRLESMSFAIGNKGYVGLGSTTIYPNANPQQDFWVLESTARKDIMSGNLYVDANNNQVFDAGEPVIKNRIVEVTPGPIYVSSNSTGNYTAICDTGTFTASIPYPPPYYTYNPQNISVTFISLVQTDSDNNFAFYPVGNVNDLRIVVTPNGEPRTGGPDHVHVTYSNVGTTMMNGTVEIVLDSNLNYVSTLPNDTTLIQSGQQLTYSFNNFLPGESRSFLIETYVAGSVANGDTITVSGIIYPVVGDSVPADNYDLDRAQIVGSCDPNYKVVDKNSITTTQVNDGEWIEYTIWFQNVGNADAINVRIEDTLSSLLNIPTIDLLASSHTCNFMMEGSGIAKFYFDNIHLPDSNTNEPYSHGFVKYRIKAQTNLSVGNVIQNNAGIYFDNNSVVVTNTVNTVVTNPTIIHEITDNGVSIKVFPNPNTGSFVVEYLSGNSSDGVIQLYNSIGELVRNEKMNFNKGNNSIHFEELSSGIYQLKIQVGDFIRLNKIVVSK